MPLVVTAQRLIDVGEVAVLVVAEEPQPVEKTRVRTERRAGAVRQRRVRIAFEPGIEREQLRVERTRYLGAAAAEECLTEYGLVLEHVGEVVRPGESKAAIDCRLLAVRGPTPSRQRRL